MGISLNDNQNLQPKPSDGIESYLGEVYRLHEYLDPVDAVYWNANVIAQPLVKMMSEYRRGVYGDIPYVDNLDPMDEFTITIEPPPKQGKNPGVINYKKLAASSVIVNPIKRTGLIITASMLNDDFCMFGLYSGLSNKEDQWFNKASYNYYEGFALKELIIKPEMAKNFVDYLHTGIFKSVDTEFARH